MFKKETYNQKMQKTLEVFNKVGLNNIFSKSKSLTQFLYDGLVNIKNHSKYFEIITPKESNRRGAQLSLYFYNNSEEIFQELNKNFVIDYRKPNVLRVAPVPLYNSYFEVYKFVNELGMLLND